jgi:PAS domain S-box-containing protein
MERRDRGSFAIIAALLVVAVVCCLLAVAVAGSRTALLGASAAFGMLAGVFAIWRLRQQTSGRNAADRHLHDAETRFANIVDAAMDPIVTVDESQRIVVFNAAAEQAFGRTRSEVIGRSLDILIPERFRHLHRRHVERFGMTGTTARRMGTSVLWALRADGDEFPIEASISQHVDGGRRFYTVILRDVGERMRSELLLSRSEARLRGILDSAMDAIITTDEQQRVILFNNAAESMFGWSRAEALGAPLATLIPERYRRAHADHVDRFGLAGTTSRRMGGALRSSRVPKEWGSSFMLEQRRRMAASASRQKSRCAGSAISRMAARTLNSRRATWG